MALWLLALTLLACEGIFVSTGARQFDSRWAPLASPHCCWHLDVGTAMSRAAVLHTMIVLKPAQALTPLPTIGETSVFVWHVPICCDVLA